MKKRKISKTRTPYNIRDAKQKPSSMRAQAGLSLFFEKRSIFPQGTEKNPVRASKPRIVTINNIDGVSGLRTAHTRWAQKYPSFFDQILNPLFGCKKPIMSPSKIYLHFSHIEKTLKKAVQELVDFCMVFLKMFYEISHFPPCLSDTIKKMFRFFWKPRAPVFVFSHVSFKTFFQKQIKFFQKI